MAFACIPTLPSIPDVPDVEDERSHLLPIDVESILTAAGDVGRTSTEASDQGGYDPRLLLQQRPSVHPTSAGQLPSLAKSCCSDLACQTKIFQVPLEGDNKTVLESWTIVWHAPSTRVVSWFNCLGIRWWARTEAENPHILSVVPNVHFSQEELASVCARDQAQFAADTTTTRKTSNPALLCCEDLERRLRRLDWTVQDEIYDLLNDRVQSSSNAFRRREWKVVVLMQAPGGEMTDAPVIKQTQKKTRTCGRRFLLRKMLSLGKQKQAATPPITEYHLILRGTEVKTNEKGWGYFNRYSRPWRDVDEKELNGADTYTSRTRRWSRDSTQFGDSKYLNF
ncbi:hypothetical protein QBC46DRAFT_392856 [Diplogelasinospora grovesii]|uniref:Uncharacterized protein n=1 Tax=Diplogelasinospora grovesii TaxID=303347 RepID=A0AAN6S1S9_9PEZI|nr:hypothetical protein QBC46DRAFT_392856 [Diplogelasinospora grovesii]